MDSARQTAAGVWEVMVVLHVMEGLEMDSVFGLIHQLSESATLTYSESGSTAAGSVIVHGDAGNRCNGRQSC